MKIEKIRIDDFGVFHDLTSPDPLPAGLCVIRGDNEAGKTTLLAFLRGILFGFPDGRSSENQYRLPAAAPQGGVLTLTTRSEDRYVVERHRGHRNGRPDVTLPDGRPGADGTLGQLLGFATRDLFRNIFAFSLTELQQFQSLSDEAVRTTIYSAGIGTGRLSVSTIDRELEGVQAGLFKSGGSTPIINRGLKDLEAVRRKLRDLAGNQGQFDTLRAELARVEDTLSDLRLRKGAATARRDRARRLLNAFPDWVALKAAQTELVGLPVVVVFPSEGLALLAAVDQKLDGLAERAEQVLAELRECEANCAALVLDESVEAQAGEIERLKRGRDHFDSAQREHPAVAQELKSTDERLADLLLDLGPDWSAARVQAFNTSIAEREVVRSHRDALRDAQTAFRDCQQRLDLANRALQSATVAEQEAAQALAVLPAPAERDTAVLAARRRDLLRLAGVLREQKALHQTVVQLSEREADGIREEEGLLQQLEQGGRPLPAWPAAAIVSMGVLVAAIMFVQKDYLPGVLVLAGLVLPLSAGYWALRRALVRQGEPALRQMEVRLEAVKGRLADIARQRMAAEGSAATLEAQVRMARDHLGIAGDVDEKVADALADQVETALEALREWSTRAADHRRVEERAKGAREEAEDVTRARNSAELGLVAAQGRWARWLLGAGLREDVTPDGALEIAKLIGECREQSKAAAALRERFRRIEAHVEDYGREVREVAARCGAESSASDSVAVVLDRLEERLRVAKGNRAERSALDGRITELRREAALLADRRKAGEQERDDLLSSGGARDAADFRERASVWARRQDLLREIARRTMALERAGGQGEHLDAFEEELSRVVPAEQETIDAQAESELRQIEEALAGAGDARGRLAERIDSLGADDRCAALRVEEQRLLTELREAARSWAVHALARALLGEAKDRYERERQPGVIRDAGVFFERMTRGKYPQIFAAPEEFSLQVLDAAGHRKQMSQLSRGTVEQLYLSVRLGLIREFSRRQESLPVVMDDILANFDPHRAAATLDVLLEMAQTHQILLLTCHPETCDLVTSLAPTTPIYRLADGGLSLSA